MPLPNSFHKNPHKSARCNPKKSSLNFLTFSLIIILPDFQAVIPLYQIIKPVKIHITIPLPAYPEKNQISRNQYHFRSFKRMYPR